MYQKEIPNVIDILDEKELEALDCYEERVFFREQLVAEWLVKLRFGDDDIRK